MRICRNNHLSKINFLYKFYRKPDPYDVGILKLKNPLHLSKNVSKIRLCKDVPTGLAIMASGWNPTLSNLTSDEFSLLTEPKILRKIYIQMISQDECKQITKTIPNQYGKIMSDVIHSNFICITLVNDGASSCDVSSKLQIHFYTIISINFFICSKHTWNWIYLHIWKLSE